MEGFVRHCACDLPLAPDCRYTENGYDINLGAGLWKSVTGLRNSYRITLADPERGEATWFGSIEEHGLFTMMALRLRVANGYITELETIIARPEKPATGQQLLKATFTLFVPPLSADLDPAAFRTPAPALTRATPGSRAEITSAIDSYQDACAHKNPGLARLDKNPTLRDNGHPSGDLAQSPMALHTSVRGRRTLVVDTAQGLALAVVLRDNAATNATAPAEFLAPWTDLHAQLLKVESGRITHLDELVKRLPYGRESGWGSSTLPA